MNIEKLLKFSLNDSSILLEKGELVDITNHTKTALMPKHLFIDKKYKIKSSDVYMCKSDIILTIAKKSHSHPYISSLYCKYDNKHILIMANNSYVFFNGLSVEPVEFSMLNMDNYMNTIY
jgi:hypothetical protein|uniref:Uncharacterized protein n=1 Tax=viral metagenome TaxID=1070528 RepID=A0A6C0CY93_9ZZZZ